MLRFYIILSLLILYTSYKALQIWPEHYYTSVICSGFIFLLMLSDMFIYRAHHHVFEKSWFKALALLSSLIMGVWSSFVIISLPLDFFNLLNNHFSFINSNLSAKIFSSSTHSFILYASIIFVALGFLQMLFGPRIENVNIGIKNLKPELDGLKITQISDLHIGPVLRKSYVEEMVNIVNKTDPDIILITGDIADAYVHSIESHMEPLRNLKSRLGVFYVLGNHEYYWNALDFIDKSKDLGFNILLNENKVMQSNNAKILLAGITDKAGGDFIEGHIPDIEKAAKTSEKTDLKILLAHRPGDGVIPEKLGFHLQFSGHTHAGQFFPFSLLIGFAHKYNRGLYEYGNLKIYVNPGTGHWGPATRLGVAAEVTAVKLKRS